MAGMTTGEALVESLLAHGIDTIFGLPGVHNDWLFDAFHGAGDRLAVLHTRHEQTAAYMALGAALVSGTPQVFSVVPGPGFLNASAALLTAYGMNAPVLALLGQIPARDIDRGHGHLHEIHDQIGIARHFTKFSARIDAPNDAPRLVADAFRAMTTGRPRPVALECGMDVWGRRGPVVFPDIGASPPPPIDDDAVADAAKIIAAAKRPLIYVGAGAIDAGEEVRRLAERIEAPVGSWRRGRGVLPTTHRLAVSLPVAHRLWKDADVVIGIGTRLHMQMTQWGTDDAMKIVRIDIDPTEPARLTQPHAALIGDARTQLAALLNALDPIAPRPASRETELAGHRAWMAEVLEGLRPQVDYLKAIRAALPENGIFVDEVTQVGFVSRLAFPVTQPRTYLSPGYQDNLGWGYGTALGAKARLRDRAVVSIAGDGGALYQIIELATAVRHKLGVVSIVFDNGMFGNVRRIQEENYGNRIIATDLANPDFVAFAQSFGIAGRRAHTPAELETQLTEAIARAEPALIHVPCGPMPSPWPYTLMPKIRG